MRRVFGVVFGDSPNWIAAQPVSAEESESEPSRSDANGNASAELPPSLPGRLADAPEKRYRRITVDEFDFRKAPEYTHKPVSVWSVTFAITDHIVPTIINGIKETQNLAKRGAAIIKGPLGERYVPGDFSGSFEPDPANPWQYLGKPHTNIRAVKMTEPVEFMPPWKQLQQVDDGYFARTINDLPDGTPDARLIEKRAFRLVWDPVAPADDVNETPPVASE